MDQFGNKRKYIFSMQLTLYLIFDSVLWFIFKEHIFLLIIRLINQNSDNLLPLRKLELVFFGSEHRVTQNRRTVGN